MVSGQDGDGPSDDGGSVILEDLLAAVDGGPVRVNRRRPSVLERIIWSLACVPTLALLLVASLAVRVRLVDGAWPVRNQPDPKDLGFHNTVTLAAILASFVVALVVPFLALAAFGAGRRRISWGPPVLAVAGFALLFVLLWADAGGLGDWIAD